LDINSNKNIINKAENQLLIIDNNKKKIKKEIYLLYDNYLSILRQKINDSTKRSVYKLFNLYSKDIGLSRDKINIFLNKN